MNNRRVFIFALLTKLTVSPQFLLLGHLHDTENIFFFRPVFATKQKTIHCLKWTLMSLCPVTFWYIFFLILMVRYVVGSFDPRPQLSGPRFVSSCGSLLLATVSTLALFILFLFIFIVSSGNFFFNWYLEDHKSYFKIVMRKGDWLVTTRDSTHYHHVWMVTSRFKPFVYKI